jgi:hypothetical protein
MYFILLSYVSSHEHMWLVAPGVEGRKGGKKQGERRKGGEEKGQR